jgi:cobalt-precorrin 5A hydrolase
MKVAGFGFRSAVSAGSLAEALALAGGASGLTALATAQDKVAGLQAFADGIGLPVIGLSRDALENVITHTQSARVRVQFGTGSLAEAAALAAAGPGARLKGKRSQSSDGAATCAIAEGAP